MTNEEAKARWAEMSQEERVEMARAAPRLATAWEPGTSEGTWCRKEPGRRLWATWLYPEGALGYRAILSFDEHGMSLRDLETAKAYADRCLVEAGYVLEGGPA